MGLEGERNSWRQVLAQTDETIAAHADGWASEETYAEVAALRDQCRTEIGRIEAEMADLSEVASETVVTVADYADALAELSEIVSGLVGGDE